MEQISEPLKKLLRQKVRWPKGKNTQLDLKAQLAFEGWLERFGLMYRELGRGIVATETRRFQNFVYYPLDRLKLYFDGMREVLPPGGNITTWLPYLDDTQRTVEKAIQNYNPERQCLLMICDFSEKGASFTFDIFRIVSKKELLQQVTDRINAGRKPY